MEIETSDDLMKVLRDFGYSNSAITQIVKWYGNGKTPSMH